MDHQGQPQPQQNPSQPAGTHTEPEFVEITSHIMSHNVFYGQPGEVFRQNYAVPGNGRLELVMSGGSGRSVSSDNKVLSPDDAAVQKMSNAKSAQGGNTDSVPGNDLTPVPRPDPSSNQ